MFHFYDTLPTGIQIFNFEIRFYAIFIIVGAVLAYILSRVFCRREGLDDHILEGTFYIGFPMGIVGARIWYVIAEWGKEFANVPFYKVFFIWEGGLAIQGGVILGAIAGMAYIHYKKPNYNVFEIADYVVPNILIAQALGRWGNFFNREVYGICVDESSWSFLPGFMREQLKYDSQGYLACNSGQIVAPLFLIESVVNLLGYVLLMFVIRKLLRKYRRPGDLVASYLIWYGIVRAIMEPMRDKQFQMGTNTMSSFIMAIIFIVLGILLIVFFHLLDNYKKRRLVGVDDYRAAYFLKREDFENKEDFRALKEEKINVEENNNIEDNNENEAKENNDVEENKENKIDENNPL